MMHWSDVYPHNIWTNILVLDGKVVDYKIGGSSRDKWSWTIRRDNEVVVLSFPKSVNNDEEHEKAFKSGRAIVDKMIEIYGTYL